MSNKTVVGRGAWVLSTTLIASVVFSWWIGRIFLWAKGDEESASAWYQPSWHKGLCLAGLFYASSVAGALFILFSRMLQNGRPQTVPGWMSVEAVPVKVGVGATGLFDRQCDQKVVDLLVSKSNLDFWPDATLPAVVFIGGSILGGYLIYRNFSRSLYGEASHAKADRYQFRPSFFKEGVLDKWIYEGLLTSAEIAKHRW